MNERDQLILDLYADGFVPSDIAEQAGCSVGTIYNVLKRNGAKTRNHCTGINVTIRNEIIERYQNFESVYAISNAMGLYPEKVKKVLKEANIKEISYSKRINQDLNEDYFKVIDSDEKAYWLGWLITDGGVSKNAITVTLQERDRAILEMFQGDLGLRDRISPFNSAYTRFSFCCKEMVADLSQYGIIPNKTFTVDIPTIDKKFYPALLRGCFEGDGWILITNRRGRFEYEFGFVGNEACVNSFNNLISELTGIPKKNVNKSNNMFRVRWSSKAEILKIFNVLYKDCGTHKLDRKYEKLVTISQGNTEIN